MEEVKPTGTVLRIYATMLQDPTGQHYALELSKSALISIGTIYSVLARLEMAGVITSQVEAESPRLLGRPARRYYKFTEQGAKKADVDLRAGQKALFIGRGLTYV